MSNSYIFYPIIAGLICIGLGALTDRVIKNPIESGSIIVYFIGAALISIGAIGFIIKLLIKVFE